MNKYMKYITEGIQNLASVVVIILFLVMLGLAVYLGGSE